MCNENLFLLLKKQKNGWLLRTIMQLLQIMQYKNKHIQTKKGVQCPKYLVRSYEVWVFSTY